MSRNEMMGKRIVAIILTVILTVGLIPVMGETVPAKADEPQKSITGLGTYGISNPIQPDNGTTDGSWQGSYVYYGKYDADTTDAIPAQIVKYRVLDKESYDFGVEGGSILLDCDSSIVNKHFDEDSNVWADSDIKGWLNGNDFYKNENIFTAQEMAAIESSTKGELVAGDGNGLLALEYAPLEGEHIFFLDAKEATRPSYGYANTAYNNATRHKPGMCKRWWLRSPEKYEDTRAGLVSYYGAVGNGYVYENYDGGNGVSPAFNINLSSVIFITQIKESETDAAGNPYPYGGEYKLTILDRNMNIGLNGNVELNGDIVTVPYIITGTDAGNATQVSVLLMDSPYIPGKSVSADDFEYLRLQYSGTNAFNNTDTGSTGYFKLPAKYQGKEMGVDYYAYILAEQVNIDDTATDNVDESWLTDYASAPVALADMITGFGTGAITNPVVPTSRTNSKWNGSYVYYGTYGEDAEHNKLPVKYRILDKDTIDFSAGATDADKAHTMLLDSDGTLFTKRFDYDSNVWKDSEIRAFLNTDNGGFLNTSFSSAEKKVIAVSTKSAKIDGQDGNGWDSLEFAALSEDGEHKDYVFLLDAVEASRSSYGYFDSDYLDSNRVKTGADTWWWLRSPYSGSIAGCVDSIGLLCYSDINDASMGVSPAFNINLSSVIFSILVKGTSDEYKLTLKDEAMTVGITENSEVTKTGNEITVPFTVTYDTTGLNAGENPDIIADRIFVMILDKEYTESNGNNAKLLQYGKLKDVVDINGDALVLSDFSVNTAADGTAANTKTISGVGTFTIDADKLPKKVNGEPGTLGTDYFVYIMAQKANVDDCDADTPTAVNESKYTDYVSAPCKLPHVHELSAYAVVNGDGTSTVTAFCQNNGDGSCSFASGQVGLTISKPAHEVYLDGNDAEAVITDTDGIQGNAAVHYYKADENGNKAGSELAAAPTDAGKYYAEITLGAGEGKHSLATSNSVTAYVVYTIAKKDISTLAALPVVSMDGYAYKGTVSIPELLNNPDAVNIDVNNTDNVAFYYNTINSSTGGEAWTGITNTTLDAGTYYMYAVIAESANYSGYTTATTQVEISKAANPMVAVTDAAVTVDGNTLELSGNISNAEGTVTYAIGTDSTSGGCSVDENTGVFTSGSSTGECTVTVTASGNTNYEPATATITVTITDKQTQNISFTDAAVEKTYGDGTFTNPVAGAQTDVTYSVISGDDVAEVDIANGTVTILKAGTAVIKATAEETSTIAEGTVTYTLTVNPKVIDNPEIVLSESTFNYDGTAKTPSVIVNEISGGTEIPAFEYTVSYSDNKNAGIATVTITDNDNGNYTVNGSTTFTINKVPATVTVADKSKTYGAADPVLTATVTGLIGNDTLNYTLTRTVGENVGTYAISVTLGQNPNYEVATESGNFTITAKVLDAPTIVLSESNFTYDGTEKKPTVTVKDGSVVVDASEYNVSYSNNKNVGTATVTITDIVGGNYQVSGNSTFTINKAPATVTAADKSKVYGSADPVLTATVTGLKGSDTLNYTLERAEGENVGTYAISVTLGQNPNYEVKTESGSFTIAAKVLDAPTIVLLENTFTFDGDEKKPAVTVKDGNALIDASEYDVSYSNNKNAGTATVTVTAVAGGNYQVSGSTTFIITKADPAYTVPTEIKATVGQKLSEVSLPTGWAWADETVELSKKGSKSFKAEFTPDDTDNYNVVSNIDVTVDVSGKEPTDTPSPDPTNTITPDPTQAPVYVPTVITTPDPTPTLDPNVKTVYNEDGTITKIKVTKKADGTVVTTSTTTDKDGNFVSKVVETRSTTKKGTKVVTTVTDLADKTNIVKEEKEYTSGTKSVKETTTYPDKSSYYTGETLYASGTKSNTIKTKAADGSTTYQNIKQKADGTVTTKDKTKDAIGNTTYVKTVANTDGSSVITRKTTDVMGISYSGKTTIDPEGNTSTKATFTLPDKGKIKLTSVTDALGKVIEGIVKILTDTVDAGWFTESKDITEVIIGKDVTSIAEKAFYNAKNLKTVIIYSDKITEVGDLAFSGINKKAVFKIKTGKKAYKKLVELIKASGVGKKVKFKRVK